MVKRFLLCAVLCLAGVLSAAAQPGGVPRFDIGQPVLTEVWLDPVAGNDANSGATRATALKTLRAAWAKVPAQLTTGVTIKITPGLVPCGAWCGNFLSDKRGSYAAPFVMEAADGPGTVTIEGGLDVNRVDYFYLFDLTLAAGDEYGLTTNDVLHFAFSNNVLLRGVTLRGARPGTQEALKANQCTNVFVEDSTMLRATGAVLDFFAVTGGHVIGSKFSEGNWGLYVKGASAGIVIAGNDVFDTHLGIGAGEGSALQYMQPPYLSYEALDVKIINNVLYRVAGTPIAVQGGFNILVAHNSIYRSACAEAGGYGLFTVGFGTRICTADAETCRRMVAAGAWGPTEPGKSGGIPSRHVYAFNNVVNNPAGCQTLYGHFAFYGSAARGESFGNMPEVIKADDDLIVRGNVIWNGPANTLMGMEYGGPWGCQAGNPTCTAEQLKRENQINTVQPVMPGAARGDLRWRPALYLPGEKIKVAAIPDFPGGDAPPGVPAGNLSNQVAFDRYGLARRGKLNMPGAYSLWGVVLPRL